MQEHTWATAPDTDELARLSAQLEAQNTRPAPPPVTPRVGRGAVQVDVQKNGEMTITHHGVQTAYATPITPPGMVEVPGLGLTSIAAAVAAGILSAGWTQGQPTGFEKAAGEKTATGTPSATNGNASAAPAGHKNTTTTTSTGDGDDNDRADNGPDYAARKAAVDVASRVLADCDNSLGAAAVDQLLQSAAETGELPSLDALPAGVSEEAAQAVYAGYAAQADNVLAEVRASVSGLEEMLTDAELQQARHAVLNRDPLALQELGRVSLQRLAQLPEQDPERFRSMVEGLPPQERSALTFDKRRKEWAVTHPDYGRMSFGAAVNLGIARF